jgi:hypothetical protein
VPPDVDPFVLLTDHRGKTTWCDGHTKCMMDTQSVAYPHNAVLFSHERNEVLTSSSVGELGNKMLNERSQTQRVIY